MKKICWDIDGVQADFVKDLRTYFNFVQDIPYSQMPEPTTYQFANEWGLTVAQWHTYYRDFVMARSLSNMNTTESIYEILKAMYHAKQLGYKNIICTVRGTEYTDTGFVTIAKKDTKDWLTGNCIIVHVDDILHTRDKAAVDADVFIDDAPHHLESIRLAGKRAICYSQSYNKEWDGERVNNLQEFVEKLKDVDRPIRKAA